MAFLRKEPVTGNMAIFNDGLLNIEQFPADNERLIIGYFERLHHLPPGWR
jgi:hypothetical protein